MPTETQRTFEKFFETYAPLAGAYDELQQDGVVRAPFQKLFKSLESVGHAEFTRRWTQAQRTVRDNGIAYSGFSGKSSRPRNWTLDAIPLLLDASEWDNVKISLDQRARLLDLVTRDLYGSQKLIRKGLLPPSIIHANPNYHRHFIDPIGKYKRWLHLYSADIARSPDGQWWLLADRTEAPSGLGYMLEHRIIASRMLPEAFRSCNIRRLAPFFVALQETLRGQATYNRDNPRIVLLSDGPSNPYHQEDAYLARYLGITLVEDGDLAVRTGRTMLKTLGGLQRIDVVFRHQNSHDSDPLMHNSVLGVAGLHQSVKSKEVTVANRLGSGLLESPAFMPFMPQLCQAILGEELLMPNVASWWCEQPESLKYVLANLDRLTIQPAFRRRGRSDGLREKLHSMPKDQLAELIRANPREFVAQEQVTRSTVATWGTDLDAERVAVRCYAVASGDSYHVLDGGLGRVTENNDPIEITIRKGEKSQDVWICSEGPVPHVSLLGKRESSQEVRRSGSDLPSRVADDLFWLGRRLERAESHARLVKVTLSRIVGETPNEECIELPMLMRCLATDGLIESGYAVEEMRRSLPDIEVNLPKFVFDDSQSDSLRSGLDRLVQIGSRLRDRLSLLAWRIIQEIDDGFRLTDPTHATATDLLEVTDHLLVHLAAISGIVMENMTRTQVYQFLDLGRRIERSLQTLSILEEGLVNQPQTNEDSPEPHVLSAVLELADSLMTYRSRYLANMQLAGVTDLLINDETNPRSLAFQFVRLQRHIEQLPRQEGTVGFTSEQRAIMSLVTDARMFDYEGLKFEATKRAGEKKELTELSCLGDWEKQINRLSQMISHRYLVHASSTFQLSEIDSEF